MRTNTQEAVLCAYIASIGKRTPRDAAQDAAELCRFANSLNRLQQRSARLRRIPRSARWLLQHLRRTGMRLRHREVKPCTTA